MRNTLRFPCQPVQVMPSKRGYDLAREVRRCLRVPGTVPFAFEQLAQESIPVLSAERSRGRSVDGLFGLTASGAPCCCTARRLEASQRFVVARGLADFFAGRLNDPVLLSAAETQQQQLGRAFAAELLAPARLIRERLSGEVVTPDEIDDLAVDFNVSTHVIEHQVENHRLAQLDGSGH
jgi:hypothetical protein